MLANFGTYTSISILFYIYRKELMCVIRKTLISIAIRVAFGLSTLRDSKISKFLIIITGG